MGVADMKVHSRNLLPASWLALGMILLAAQPAPAWTQENNQYTTYGSGSPYCGGSQALPSMHWQEPQHYSITIYGEINLSLTSMPPHWLPDMADAFNDFNSVPAANPYQYTCQTAGCGQVDYYGGVVSCPLLATTGYLITNTEYSST